MGSYFIIFLELLTYLIKKKKRNILKGHLIFKRKCYVQHKQNCGPRKPKLKNG